MERRVVSLWLPDFPTDRLIRRWEALNPGGGWRDRPVATVQASANGGAWLAAVNPAARAGGAFPGLPLAEARARLPELATAPADPAGDARSLDALAEACGRYTPWTAVDGFPGSGGGLWLDVSGCAHLFGGEEGLLAALRDRLRGQGLACRAVLAATPGAAWALARFGAAENAILPAGEEGKALAPLPAAALRLEAAVLEGLDRVGLRRLGDLLALPRAPLAARFGETVARRLDQALGREDEPLSPRRPQPLREARLAFAEPIGRPEDMAAALAKLLAELCAGLARDRLGARRLDLTAWRVDGSAVAAAVGTGRPSRDPAALALLFREKLAALDLGFGVEVLALGLSAADPLAAAQAGLLERDEGQEDLDRLLDRLGNRLGFERVQRLEPCASHIPERACRAVPASAPLKTAPLAARPRPLHLLPWPEPVEALAPLPDGPPALFRWRRQPHRIVAAEGPERIGGEWWLEDPGIPEDDIRDYYRVEDAEGRRFWLYRQGFYRPDRPPRWFLHGFFP